MTPPDVIMFNDLEYRVIGGEFAPTYAGTMMGHPCARTNRAAQQEAIKVARGRSAEGAVLIPPELSAGQPDQTYRTRYGDPAEFMPYWRYIIDLESPQPVPAATEREDRLEADLGPATFSMCSVVVYTNTPGDFRVLAAEALKQFDWQEAAVGGWY